MVPLAVLRRMVPRPVPSLPLNVVGVVWMLARVKPEPMLIEPLVTPAEKSA